MYIRPFSFYNIQYISAAKNAHKGTFLAAF